MFTHCRIHTVPLEYLGAVCVRFAYFMQPNHDDALTMYTLIKHPTYNTAINQSTQWKIHGTDWKDHSWHMAKVDVMLTDKCQSVGFTVQKSQ